MKNRSLTPILVIFSLSIFFFFTRLFNLLALPIFTDESIYIYWAKVIATSHSQWFISLTDGKPPLLIWIIATLLSIFPQEMYLVAGRLPSVLMGLISMVGVYKISEILFSKRAGVIAAILYIICPMTLFYDRMALFDSMLTAMLVMSVYFALRTGKTRKIEDGLLWGLFLGLAFLSKPTALVFLPLTVLAAFLMLSGSDLKKHWKRLALLSGLALIIGEILNNLQRVSSAYPASLRKNAQFQQPLSELLKHPFLFTLGSLGGFLSWTITYLTPPLFILGIISFIFGFFKKPRETLILLILWFVPLLVIATVGREVFPRYILIVIPYILIQCAFTIDYLLNLKGILRIGVIVALVIVSLPILYFDYLILTDPKSAPLPVLDRNQYVLHHPSGYGLDEVLNFINSESEKSDITIVTQGTFGLYPYAFYMEYWGDPSVRILPKWPLGEIDDEIISASEAGPVYIILKDHDEIPPNLPLKLVFKAEKPEGKFPIIVATLDESRL